MITKMNHKHKGKGIVKVDNSRGQGKQTLQNLKVLNFRTEAGGMPNLYYKVFEKKCK